MSGKWLANITLFTTLMLSVVTASLANEPPTKPPNLAGIVVSDSEVKLTWDASTDDKRVKNYSIYVDGARVATTRSRQYSVGNLVSNTLYEFGVEAYDGAAVSFLASVSLTTLTSTTDEEDSADPAPTNCKGKNRKLPECQEPPVEEPPVEEPPVEEPPVEEPPVEEPPVEEPPVEEPPVEEPPVEEPPVEEPPEEEPSVSTRAPAGWNIVFEDNFDGTGDIDTSSDNKLWRFETMVDPLHRAGNTGMDEFGNTDVDFWRSPLGKRWSGWYNGYNKDNAYRSNGMLVMQGLVTDESDPTRPIDYIDNGVLTQYGSGKLYTAWLDTWSRKYDAVLDKQVVNPDSPNKTFKYGYFESRVNFSEMVTPGFRLSMWLMPATSDAQGQNLVESNAYDSSGDNGVEIDIFEYEWIGASEENRIQMSLHGGAAGGSSTNFDTSAIDINLHEGWHTIGLLWMADRLVWSIDGNVVHVVTDTSLIPDVYSYLILSREMNSGVKAEGIDATESGDMLEELPYRPRDPGLYAQNIWEFRDRIATDRALVDYIRVWQP